MIKKIGLLITITFLQLSSHLCAMDTEANENTTKTIVKHNPVVVVTGGNRGIGFEICRQLATRGAQVVLTARNQELGEEAVRKLASQNLSVKFYPLDVKNSESINRLSHFLETTFGYLDVLINNAGIMSKTQDSVSGVEPTLMQNMLETNAYAPFNLSRALVALLKQSKTKLPRIINISSGMGELTYMQNMFPAYSISKTALNAFTRILSAQYPDIAVNSVCPGWVKTEMGGEGAQREIQDGAMGPVWHALDAPQDLTGKFTRDTKEIPW